MTISVAASDQAFPVLAQIVETARQTAESVAESRDTISVQEAAAINIAAKIGRLEALQERAVEAAERQASALEAVAALLASCIGVGSARCYAEGEQSGRDVPLNYLRSGNGTMPFACDADKLGSGDE